VFNGTCTYSFGASAFSVSPEAQSLQIGVTTPQGCSWSVLSNTTWAVSGSAGNGPGTAIIQIAANTSITTRTAILTIGGLNITVSQTGIPCQATFWSHGSYFPSSSGTYSVPVSAPQGCSWNAVPYSPFVQVLSGPTVGPGEVRFFVDTNTGPGRTTVLIIGGKELYTINQVGVPCAIVPIPQQTWVPSSGGTYNLGVSTGAGCPWSVSSDVPWMQVSPTGSGPAPVPFTVQPNPTPQMRIGRLWFGAYPVTVNQIGAPR
jgi:hypothetical protein